MFNQGKCARRRFESGEVRDQEGEVEERESRRERGRGQGRGRGGERDGKAPSHISPTF